MASALFQSKPSAPASVASHVSQFGSASLLYSYSSPGHVAAQMAAIDASRSLSYTYSFIEPMNMPGHDSRQVLEGLWWKHDQGVTAFITLTAEYIFFGGKRIATLPGNAISNGGFEQGLSGWTPWGTWITAQLITNPTTCHFGSNCLHLPTPPEEYPGILTANKYPSPMDRQ